MTHKEQSGRFLRDYIKAKAVFPWVASCAQSRATQCLNDIGGIAGSWRTDYSECTYATPQRVNGQAVDLSTIERVRAFHEAVDFIIANSSKFAVAKAQRVYLDEFRKSKKAILMGQSQAKAAVEREQYAYAHEDYLALLGGIKAAVEVEEDLKWKLTAAQLRVEIWRTKEASNRNQDRATR